VNPPFADKLPKPEEAVASAYDFAEQLLSQRNFARPMASGGNTGTCRRRGPPIKTSSSCPNCGSNSWPRTNRLGR
jgi:hypothetical protein